MMFEPPKVSRFKASRVALSLALLTGCGSRPASLSALLGAHEAPISGMVASPIDTARSAIEAFYTTFHDTPTIVGGTSTQTSISGLRLKPSADGASLTYTATERIVRSTFDDESGTRSGATSTVTVSGRYELASGRIIPG